MQNWCLVQCDINAELVSHVQCHINAELVSCVVQCDIDAELVSLMLCNLVSVKNSPCSQGSVKEYAPSELSEPCYSKPSASSITCNEHAAKTEKALPTAPTVRKHGCAGKSESSACITLFQSYLPYQTMALTTAIEKCTHLYDDA